MNAFVLPSGDKKKNDLLSSVVNALEILSQKGLLTGQQGKANRKVFIAHAKSLYQSGALTIFADTELLKGDSAQTNFDAIIELGGQSRIALALSQTELLKGKDAQANFDALVRHGDKENLLNLIDSYKETLLKGKDAQANFVALVQHKAPWTLLNALKSLSQPALLPELQNHFNQINQYSAILFESPQSISAWAKIAPASFTQTHFDAIMKICADHEGSPQQGAATFLSYVNENICAKRIPKPPETFGSKFPRPRPEDVDPTSTAELRQCP